MKLIKIYKVRFLDIWEISLIPDSERSIRRVSGKETQYYEFR